VARWNLLIDNNSADTATVVQLDVNDATTGTVLASRVLTRRAWTAAGQDQEFALPFTLDSSRVGHALEYRVYWYDAAYVRVQQVRVTRMTGGITESYTYDADGDRVAKTVGGVTTVYLQGLWEQIVGGASTRYYPFNDQIVAMRDSATNAVTYLHGDHLGSVSLATDNSGAVVSKQDFDPWGKARGASTIPQTSLNYTGQRLDGTGLLYYHARYYDPALARFVSADSISPDHTDPQTRNRYSYVLNNPLRYTDPSGHCAAGDGDDPAACQSAEAVLNLYGIQLDSLANWMFKELSLVIGGVVDLRMAANWSIDQFKSAMGGSISLARGGSSKYSGYESNGTITLYDSAFSNGDDEAKRVVVHEFGHRWDEASTGRLSRNLVTATGGSSWLCIDALGSCASYTPGDRAGLPRPGDDYYTQNPYEDFAESVAMSVYPGLSPNKDFTKGKRYQQIQKEF